MTAVIEVNKIKVKDILTELKRSGETYKYVAQGYYVPPSNEYNTRTFFNKESGEDEDVTKNSYAFPNRDNRTILYLNPFTRAYTQFDQYIRQLEDHAGALSNREITITFTARPSANEASRKKGLYVLEAQFEIGSKTFDIVGFPENMENGDLNGSSSTLPRAPFPPPATGTFPPPAGTRSPIITGSSPPPSPPLSPSAVLITHGTREKLMTYMKEHGLTIPSAIVAGEITELKAKNLLIALMSE